MKIDEHGQRIRTVCLCVIASVSVGVMLYWLADVLIPFVLAVLFSVTLGPVVDWLQRTVKLPRVLATFVLLSVVAALAFFIGTFIAASGKQLLAEWPTYSERLQAFLQDRLKGFGFDVPDERIRSWLGTDKEQLPKLVSTVVNALLGLIRDGAFVLLMLVFLILGEPSGDRGDTWAAIKQGIRKYVGLKVLISLMTALAVGIVLAALHVEFVPLLVLLVFLLNFVPNVGPPIAVLMPLPLIVASTELTTTESILAIAIPAAIQLTFGEFIEPKMMGRSLDLHPVTVLLSLIFWGTLWGVIGVFLAVPVTAAVKVVFDELEFMKPMANLMAGRMRLQLSERPDA
ncbi:MAG: AI-2E family transporter [Planctomycetota bacterium]